MKMMVMYVKGGNAVVTKVWVLRSFASSRRRRVTMLVKNMYECLKWSRGSKMSVVCVARKAGVVMSREGVAWVSRMV